MALQLIRPRTLVMAMATCLAANAMANGSSAVHVTSVSDMVMTPGVHAAPKLNGTSRYIVRYAEPAMARYNRSVKSGAAQRVNGVDAIPFRLLPNGRSRLDAQSSEARTYLGHLQNQQAVHESAIRSALGRDVTVVRRYQHALNAAVMLLTPREAHRIVGLKGIEAVTADVAHPLASDIGPHLIGATSIWLGQQDRSESNIFPTLASLFSAADGGAGFQGDGVVIGDIDTGYNSMSPSFQATDGNGYTITNPLGHGHYIGQCNVDGISLAGCNDKVIGVYDELDDGLNAPFSVEDTQGHGSHTASTSAGNARSASLPGFTANIAGIAPHANLVIYYACSPDPTVECSDSATSGAVDQAVQDGIVDALNFSIGGGFRPWNEPTSQAFLGAEDAGIFVAAAAGNTSASVPDAIPGTTNHIEPWVTTVAAGTSTGGNIPFFLNLTGPGTPPASTQHVVPVEGTFDTALADAFPDSTPIVVSPNFENVDTSGTDGCSAYPADTFKNSIALISRGTCAFAVKVPSAIAAGAIAVVIADNRPEGPFSPTVGPPSVSVPVYSVNQLGGYSMAAYLAAHGGTGTASLGYAPARVASTADVLAGFSLIGPATISVIKPDIQAPGVDTLAAVANDGSANGANLVALYNGTSMATPHITGSGALLMGLHPDWTPMQVKSALMMTSEELHLTQADGTTPSGSFDRGSGRVQVFLANRAGLVLDEATTNFLNAYPDGGGDPSKLNLASLQNDNCATSCVFNRTFHGTQASTVTWTASVSGELAANVSVKPAVFSAAQDQDVGVAFSVSSAALPTDRSYHFAEVTLTPSDTSLPSLHIPLAVAVPRPVLTVTPSPLQISLQGAASAKGELSLSNAGGPNLVVQALTGGNLPYTWIDLPSANYYGSFSTYYPDLDFADSDYYAADDFFITGNVNVNLTSIVTPGFSANDPLSAFGPDLKLHWRVYADKDGVPSSNPDSSGAAAWSYDATAGSPGVSVDGDTISLDLVAAGQNTNLAAGHYWLTVYPELPCGTSGQGCEELWIWLNSWTGNGTLPVGIQPERGDDSAWTTFDPLAGLGLAMTITSEVACSKPDWLSVTPSPYTAGFIDVANTTLTVTATADKFGDASGVTGYMCLRGFQDGLPMVPLGIVPVQVNANK